MLHPIAQLFTGKKRQIYLNWNTLKLYQYFLLLSATYIHKVVLGGSSHRRKAYTNIQCARVAFWEVIYACERGYMILNGVASCRVSHSKYAAKSGEGMSNWILWMHASLVYCTMCYGVTLLLNWFSCMFLGASHLKTPNKPQQCILIWYADETAIATLPHNSSI